ncbi:MAG: hypothetical protein GX049_09185 [Alcaligenaceae bacterium]|nr:hypothetical protein [Alcaligenaceae bacterium]
MTHTKRPVKQILTAATLVLTLFISGCASTGSAMLSGPSADPRLTQGNDAQFFSKSGYQACAAGAAVGVLGCLVSNSSNKAVCAIAAGIAACGVAMGANYYLDYRRNEYANTSERLSVMTQDVKADTEKVIARTTTMQAVIKDDEARLASIQRQMKAQALDAEKAKKELASVDKNLNFMQEEVKKIQNKVEQYREVAVNERAAGNTQQVRNLEKQISEMDKRTVALKENIDSLYNQRNAIELG